MERPPSTGVAAAVARTRAGRALRRSQNWIQLAKFGAVGATGYVVNLAVYATLVRGFDVDYRIAAVCSFVVAVANNYTWNRLWTFSGSGGPVALQGMRFLAIALVALAANLVVLDVLVALDFDEVLAQAIAIVLVTPINFVGNKLWTFRRRS
jgi:dolichol-phosphate mannosyltransferase